MIVDMPTGAIVDANSAGCLRFGYDREDVVGSNIRRFVHPDDQEQFVDITRQVRTGAAASYMQRWRSSEGWRQFEVFARLLVDDRLLVWGRDRSELDASRNQLELLTRLVDVTGDLLVVSNVDGRVIWANQATSVLHGVSRDNIVGRRLVEFLWDDESRQNFMGLAVALTNENNRADTRLRVIDANNEPVDLWTSTVYDPDTDLFYTVERDMTELVQAESRLQRLNQKLAEQVGTDSLTNLPNRRALVESMNAVADGQECAALLLFDLDRFKLINDSLGHEFGDLLLRSVSDRLRAIRPTPLLVARLGGDEFAMLIETDSLDLALKSGAHIVALLAEPHTIQGRRIDCTTSVGVALTGPGEHAGSLLRKADLAMYRAKSEGRNRVALFDEQLREQIESRYQIEAALRDSLGTGMISPAGQRIHRIADGGVACIEVLARWNHPELTGMGPTNFISVAEDAGLLDPLTFELTTAAVAASVEAGEEPTLAINVAPSQLVAPDFARRFVDAVRRGGGRCDRIIVEVTESGLTGAVDEASGTLEALGQAGIRLMIDDFGTGASALSYLRSLPLAGVKIDGSFVQNIEIDPTIAIITQSVIALSRQLGLITVAEWVETQAQHDTLASMGCDWVQGFLHHQPEPIIGAVKPLTRQRR